MAPKARGILIGMSGLITGYVAAQRVDWPIAGRVALALGVAVAVSVMVMFTTRNEVPA